ncbi:hypothetical protein JCM21714_3887 [Gracilibacillus boraciitolerans JCM 21714]|uniref:Uncharacterized protein n=1 Tax=Gracilibacillus boraciitolerans JCM 21714 TaxID=1298598 RepID=W4VMQ0_9BACI|nr:hypothetical protein [Gracilibacillus boraciitolerans]GAE94705.1 hypothetical protein JCM21714_3887 [Gracilibacillus boraciitolerans JCM 21714]
MKKKILYQYPYYIGQIEWEIGQLQLQQSSLDIASTIAHQADRLWSQGGEEAAEAYGSKLNELKGWLF